MKRIMIANRGEIAGRIGRAALELGHIPIGLWTDSEPDAGHLAFCREWVRLEGRMHAETYLNIPRLVALAKKHRIDAVHPGYGFLAENGDFAEALAKEGIIFIGPNPKAIRDMGDKAVSKTIARKAGVPVVPGSEGAVKNVSAALEAARETGYPVLLKAVAGGGGRGMRICRGDKDVQEQFEAVGREAKAAFGNGGLLVEKYIENPHHIEVQLLADRKGNVFHFFERECSIQRRHQKILEEAPSPFIGNDEALRREICSTAVRLARAVGYDSAGTVEFIMGADRSFYFLEMNTRIQVEHPITEEITGIDLVVCMIQSALGEDLGITQQDWITRSGCALECRICAEDPVLMQPSPGKVTGFATSFPQGTRFDNCLHAGLEVTPDFDPLIGKLVTKGIIRPVAIRKMAAALEGLHIAGLKTNIPLHREILRNANFLAGRYSTGFLETEKPQDRIKQAIEHDSLYRQLAGIEAARMGM